MRFFISFVNSFQAVRTSLAGRLLLTDWTAEIGGAFMNSLRWIAWTKYYTASIFRFFARFRNINNPLIQVRSSWGSVYPHCRVVHYGALRWPEPMVSIINRENEVLRNDCNFFICY